jgi:serine/threonine-protein kinase
MVGEKGEVLVMDWGVAKLAASTDGQAPEQSGVRSALATRAGALVGTPSYMSPEQAWGRNDTLDPRSDLYSASVLFHELLTLEHYLGHRASSEQMLLAVITEEISLGQMIENRSPRSPLPPVELLRFVAKGLSKDPDARWKDAEEMIDALESIMEARAAIQIRLASARRTLRGLRLIVASWLHVALYSAAAIMSRLGAAVGQPAQV